MAEAGLVLTVEVSVTAVPAEIVEPELAIEIEGKEDTLKIYGVPSSVTPRLVISLLK